MTTRIMLMALLVAFALGCVSKPVSWTPDSEGKGGDNVDSRGGDADPACTPACTGKACGDDGCGGQCGECPGDNVYCMEGQCVCVPSCAGVTCGSDGCDGSCGTCPSSGYVCSDGTCCDIQCTNKECGDDGCGDVCGVCEESEKCVSGICLVQNDECDDGNDIPWDGCTAGSISEFQVNSTTDLSSQEQAAVAAQPDGSYMVAWHATQGDTDGYGIRARAFDASGVAKGPDFVLNSVEKDIQLSPALTALPDSKYAAVWLTENSDKTYVISGVIVDGDSSNVLGQEFVVEETPDKWVGSPDVCLADNAILVSWYSKIDTGANKADLEGVFGRIMSLEGTPLMDIQLQEHVPYPTHPAALARLSSGGIAAVWSSQAGGIHETDIHLALLSDSLEMTPKLTVNAHTDGWQHSPDIASSPGGDSSWCGPARKARTLPTTTTCWRSSSMMTARRLGANS